MRPIILVAGFALLVSCRQANNDPAPGTVKAVEAATGSGLYTDEHAKSIAGYDPDSLRENDEPPFREDIVPNGTVRELGDVLRSLGLDARRLREPRYHGSMHIFV